MTFEVNNPWFWAVLAWSFIWKGVALWKAGERREKKWFIALFVLNTAGLLDIFYLFHIANQKKETPSA